MDSDQYSCQLETWQRLSPLSVIFFVGRIISHIIKDALPGLAPIAVLIINSDNKLWMMFAIGGALLAAVLIGSFLQYWFFKFKRNDDKILINEGVFKKNHRVIQFDRIQNINLLQPIYFKPFELVTLQIETAGAKGQEANLAGISETFANYIREEILLKKEKYSSLDCDDKSVINEAKLIAEASLLDLVKYGVSSNGIFWFFVVLAPLIGLADDVLPKIISKNDFQQLVELLGGELWGTVFMIAIILVSVFVLMFGFSILGAILRYFNYSLVLSKQSLGQGTEEWSLKRSSGLLTRYEESLKIQKVQTVITQTNIFGKWLGIVNLTLGQVSGSQNNAKNKKSLFVIPVRNHHQTNKITQVIFTDRPDRIETKGINRRYIAKTLIFKLFLPSLIICSVIYLNRGNFLILAIPFAFSLIMLPLVVKRWKKYRYGMKDGYGRFERGLFGFRHILFPLYKVQRAEVCQSPFQRRRNLATLKIYLASNKIQMQYIPIDEANKWMDIIGENIEFNEKAWF